MSLLFSCLATLTNIDSRQMSLDSTAFRLCSARAANAGPFTAAPDIILVLAMDLTSLRKVSHAARKEGSSSESGSLSSSFSLSSSAGRGKTQQLRSGKKSLMAPLIMLYRVTSYM